MKNFLQKIKSFLTPEHVCRYVFNGYHVGPSLEIRDGVPIEETKGYFNYKCRCGLNFNTNEWGHWNMSVFRKVNY